MKVKCKVQSGCPKETIERQLQIILLLAGKCAKQKRRIAELESKCKECRFRELFDNNL